MMLFITCKNVLCEEVLRYVMLIMTITVFRSINYLLKSKVKTNFVIINSTSLDHEYLVLSR